MVGLAFTMTAFDEMNKIGKKNQTDDANQYGYIFWKFDKTGICKMRKSKAIDQRKTPEEERNEQGKRPTPPLGMTLHHTSTECEKCTA